MPAEGVYFSWIEYFEDEEDEETEKSKDKEEEDAKSEDSGHHSGEEEEEKVATTVSATPDQGVVEKVKGPGIPVPMCRSAQWLSHEQVSPVLNREQKEMNSMEKVLERDTEALDFLSRLTGLPVSQENGQRRVGPYPGSRHPPKGSEVFVGKLPKYMNESHIYNIFSTVGKIYEIRLMMDFSGTNRGFCFVKFHHPVEADRACTQLNHYYVSACRKIGVTLSVDNCILFLGGIPVNKTQQQVTEELRRVTDNLVRVFANISMTTGEHRGYAFAEYRSHRDAAMARRKMIPGKIQLWGRNIHVDWADPDSARRSDPNYQNILQPMQFGFHQQLCTYYY